MGIARALRRVKRHAKRGGLGALRSGLGEELRSGAIPGPLRSAARRIAAIIDPSSGRAYRKPAATATPAAEPARAETLRHPPPEQANQLGSDRGAPPGVAEEPDQNTIVDPVSVGATPVFDATPIEVEPVDATPTDVVNDVTSVVVTEAAPEPELAREAAAPQSEAARSAEVEETQVEVPAPEPLVSGEPTTPAKPQPKKKAGNGAPKNGVAKKKPAAAPASAKEKLAAAPEEAKSAPRSAPKAKRSGGPGGKTSKKK